MLDPIDRLVAAYPAANLPPLPPAGDVTGVLAELRAAIAPLRVPPCLERFWRRIAPHPATMAPWPRLCSAAGALQRWSELRAAKPQVAPAVLLPACGGGRQVLFVELDDGGGSAGTCFAWQGQTGFELVFSSFQAYIDLWATMIELEEFSVQNVAGRPRYTFDPLDRWGDAQRVRLGAAMPLPRYGEQVWVDADPRYWPSHWLRTNTVVPASRNPLVVVTDLIDLVRQAQSGRDAAGTVRARVTGVAGSAEGTQALIDDGTARVDLWCPASVCGVEPMMHRTFEFDIVVPATPARRIEDLSGSLRDLTWSGSADPTTPARRLSDLPHAAEAKAIRRLR